MKKIFRLFAGSIALSVLPVAQVHAQVQDVPASAAATSGRVAREAAFVAALPGVNDTPMGRAKINGETARIIRLNPGKDEAIRAVVARTTACEDNAYRAKTELLVREAAHSLSDDTLERVTAFFTGPDYRRIIQIASEAPHYTRAESAEAGAILDRYAKPLAELQRMHTTMNRNIGAELSDSMKACTDEQTTAFAQAKIRVRE